MKRTPLTRKTPLARKGAIRYRSQTKKYSRRERGWDFMAYVLWLPCELRGNAAAGSCSGRVQADHAGERPYGQKAADDTCIPLCEVHHRNRTDYRGFFKDWDKYRMREWCDERIKITKTRYTHLVMLRRTPWRANVHRTS